MFDLDPGDELDLIVSTAREFAADTLVPALREHEAARGVVASARQAYAEIGLAALELPEPLGGAGLGPLARVALNEELGAADPGAALALDPLGPALYPLAELGGEAALEELALPLLEQPEARALLVTREELGAAIDGPVVSGRVPWVPSDRVDLLVVLDDDGAVVLREGITANPLPGAGLRAAGAAELVLEDAPIASRWRDAAAAARSLARARLYAASLLLGVLRHASEFSRGYALERVAFGRPIAHHQALAFLITDMRMASTPRACSCTKRPGASTRGLDCAGRSRVGLGGVHRGRRARSDRTAYRSSAATASWRTTPSRRHMREARTLGLLLCGGFDAADRGRGTRELLRPAFQDALGPRARTRPEVRCDGLLASTKSTREPRSKPRASSGSKEVPPAGTRSGSRRGRPIPVDDPFFDRCLERGEGRTRWPAPKGRASEAASRRSIGTRPA